MTEYSSDNLRPAQLAVHCEAKKHAYRQTKDGVIVSFVLHPQEIPDSLTLAPLGTRYMIAFVQIGDDEQPVSASRHDVGAKEITREASRRFVQDKLAHGSSMFDGGVSDTKKPGCGTKERRTWYDIPVSGRAAVLCGDERFQNWLSDRFGIAIHDVEDATDWLRAHLGIQSRAELATNEPARRAFEEIERAYRVQHGLEAEIR